ncbi:hypothetical protein O7626_25395 [Micromonospora sp. WMMD1102]|nr:hypothetical protein [Micromonospora sp. WMMD1102]MDG4789226.1 hypothetical protein [Micromonospora sp. WMMD1102]
MSEVLGGLSTGGPAAVLVGLIGGVGLPAHGPLRRTDEGGAA